MGNSSEGSAEGSESIDCALILCYYYHLSTRGLARRPSSPFYGRLFILLFDLITQSRKKLFGKFHLF